MARKIRKQFGSFRAMTYDDAHRLALNISAKNLDYDVIAGYAKLEATVAENRAEQPAEPTKALVETLRIAEHGKASQDEIEISSSQAPGKEVSVPDNGTEESKKAYRKSKKAAHRLATKQAKQDQADAVMKASSAKNQKKDTDQTEMLPPIASTPGELGETTSREQTSLDEGGGEGVGKTSAGVIALSTTSDFPHTTTTHYRHHLRSHSVPPLSLLDQFSNYIVTRKDISNMSSNNQGDGTQPVGIASSNHQGDVTEPAGINSPNDQGGVTQSMYIEQHMYQPNFTLLPWAYRTNPGVDDARLVQAGLLLYDPPTTYVHEVPVPCTLAMPVLVLQSRVQDEMPVIRFDALTARIVITPHYEPWNDVRLNLGHPDWVPDQKLVEYQAVESMGQKMWRHDRQFLPCSLPTCQIPTIDHANATRICLGCGPKTLVRYCNKAHLMADLGRHYSECGHPEAVIGHPIDEMTQPLRFYGLLPAIKDIHGHMSFEKHRQRALAMENGGYYTLVNPVTGEHKKLEFIEALHERKNARIERLLNVALFDHKETVLITYLYNYLNECLTHMQRAKLLRGFAADPRAIFNQQFSLEFKDFDTAGVGTYRILCECDWFGSYQVHTSKICKKSPKCPMRSGTFGEIFRGKAIEGMLDQKEAKHFMLRIWRRQDMDEDWRLRMRGKGFPDVSEKDKEWLTLNKPGLGEGWSGWGSPVDHTKLL